MEKKKVQILLSLYQPNERFLIRQLQSLNEQDYSNLEVLIYDDGASINPCNTKIIEQCLTKVKYQILPNAEHNLGYILAFETLLKASDADYIAFCDQDDIWRSDKIRKCVEELEKSGSLAVASDRMIIDENDRVTCKSVREVSKKNYDCWKTGDDICKYNLIVTYAVGMSIVANGKFSRGCLPFSRMTGHDKWILACASTEGKVSFINDTLVQYRRHKNNVSGVLTGIHSKKDYIDKRINPLIIMLSDFFNRYPNHKDRKEVESFANARMNHSFFQLIKYRDLAPDIVKFEIALSLTPDFLFPLLVKIAQKI